MPKKEVKTAIKIFRLTFLALIFAWWIYPCTITASLFWSAAAFNFGTYLFAEDGIIRTTHNFLTCCGALLNGLVIVANGGRMPVAAAVKLVGHAGVWQQAFPTTRFMPLADVHPALWGFYYYSVGDAFIFSSIGISIVTAIAAAAIRAAIRVRREAK